MYIESPEKMKCYQILGKRFHEFAPDNSTNLYCGSSILTVMKL